MKSEGEIAPISSSLTCGAPKPNDATTTEPRPYPTPVRSGFIMIWRMMVPVDTGQPESSVPLLLREKNVAVQGAILGIGVGVRLAIGVGVERNRSRRACPSGRAAPPNEQALWYIVVANRRPRLQDIWCSSDRRHFVGPWRR